MRKEEGEDLGEKIVRCRLRLGNHAEAQRAQR
jgi:hypothetical protein